MHTSPDTFTPGQYVYLLSIPELIAIYGKNPRNPDIFNSTESNLRGSCAVRSSMLSSFGQVYAVTSEQSSSNTYRISDKSGLYFHRDWMVPVLTDAKSLEFPVFDIGDTVHLRSINTLKMMYGPGFTDIGFNYLHPGSACGVIQDMIPFFGRTFKIRDVVSQHYAPGNMPAYYRLTEYSASGPVWTFRTFHPGWMESLKTEPGLKPVDPPESCSAEDIPPSSKRAIELISLNTNIDFKI